MKLTHLTLDQLKPAKVNVRKKGGKDVADLVPSIRSLGLLQPLLVRPNCEGFEIVAGQRRYHALTKLAEEVEAQPVPCIVMEDGDDAKAIEASLAENVARLPMDEIDQYKAFAVLGEEGKDVAEIASTFGVTERLVKQRLAIANIIGPILTAYRRGDIGTETLRTMTLATKRQQQDWWALFKDEDAYAPHGYALRQWLFGGQQISVENALFELEEFIGAIVADLFGDERYFDDTDAFWTLQNEAIAKLKDDILAKGWQDVEIMEVGAFFASWEYRKATKKDGGRVYIQIAKDGEVTVHEGYITEKEAKRRDKAEAGNTDEQSCERPELTKAMQNYLALHRHAAVRLDLLSDPALALRVVAAQIIAGSALWTVYGEPQKANTEAIGESLAASTAEAAFAAEREAVRLLLGIEQDDSDTLVCRQHDYGRSHDLLTVFAKLVDLDDDSVRRILTFVVAETLPSGSALVEALGILKSADMGAHWAPDDTFFDLWKDKEAINAAVKEVAGKATADAHVTSTAKVQKKIIRDHIDGTRKPHTPDWQPRYTTFPMGTYTKRGGIDAVERGKDLKRRFKAA
ncbi:ParB/RepB/Spo0J family partition protein [Rhodobium gokarnense]|uniref:ParB family chromosome partitioning protein n=1 Tax=Rhodobium gokarnense TaxID=364296 RepID=A0ABT3HEM9_9HYPH|nr:ParB N-terminal domain-containing protein [Rhodobium gokarnense]MCW2308860.1 ParB family chromosome partitioning protein [Rhodobium gokarnense]